MAARNPSPVVKFIPIVVILIGVAIAVYFFLPRSSNAPAPGAAPASVAAGTAQPNAAATPATPMPELSKEQLIKEAGTAFREKRYVAPQGNNALDYYLRVLEKEPNNPTAADALREMFPFATGAVEQEINAGNVDEATRIIDQLAKADPNNYTLTILRQKLDSRKKQVERDQQQQTAATAAAAAKAAAATTAANPAATPAAAPAATTAAATPAPATAIPAPAPPTPVPAAPSAAPTATAAATPAPVAGGESHPAEVLKTVPPEYPRDAYVKHTEGWVEVEFTVTADGQVSNASVAGANPSRVFNDAALRAVQRWTFKPKMDNGKAVEERMTRRIEFKLGAG